MERIYEPISVLWALKSACNMKCKYCYFEEVNNEKHKVLNKTKHQLNMDHIYEIIDAIEPSKVRRVFFAGGEPTMIKDIISIIKTLCKKGIKVVLCTNGKTLNKQLFRYNLLHSGVEAISVSLDSYDREYNDYWRIDPFGNGWDDIVTGIRLVIEERENNAFPQIGVYSVITHLNIKHIEDTYLFLQSLGVDYHVIQPISLNINNPYYKDLILQPEDVADLLNGIESINTKRDRYKTKFCTRPYLKSFIDALKDPIPSGSCPCGSKLIFIDPRGKLNICPIHQPDESREMTVKAESILQSNIEFENIDMLVSRSCFMLDCINMNLLADFDYLVS